MDNVSSIKTIYINLDGDGYVLGYGDTRGNETDIEVHLDKDHDFFITGMLSWKYIDGELIQDEVERVRLLKVEQERENRPTENSLIEGAILGLAEEISQLKEEKISMALYFATKVVEGVWDYADIPNAWKEEVKNILINKDREDLII